MIAATKVFEYDLSYHVHVLNLFQQFNKRIYYAWAYGNADYAKVAIDFWHMNLMGGEL